MPVRSLTSPVLRWPDAETVHRAAQAWVTALAETTPDIIAAGYFGSYARGDAGVGSDLDLIVLLRDSALPFERRAATWPLESLPVPAEALVYTLAEWQQMPHHHPRFFRVLCDETRWLVGSPPFAC
jgi:hypothetical protein